MVSQLFQDIAILKQFEHRTEREWCFYIPNNGIIYSVSSCFVDTNYCAANCVQFYLIKFATRITITSVSIASYVLCVLTDRQQYRNFICMNNWLCQFACNTKLIHEKLTGYTPGIAA